MKYLSGYKLFEKLKVKFFDEDDDQTFILYKNNIDVGQASISFEIPNIFKNPMKNSAYLIIINMETGNGYGVFLLKYIFDKTGIDCIYFDSAEELKEIKNGIEIWSHKRWDKISTTIGHRIRDSSLSPGKKIKETLYRLDKSQIDNL